MTSLNGDPMAVSLVQVAVSLPLFLFTLPAGALADVINSRRLLIGVEIGRRHLGDFCRAGLARAAHRRFVVATTFLLGVGGA